ncbi:unnamed protein product [Mytilus coruscus]|uniref:RNase H type-1 domain-containing protein n=1 Tax=Mytilus coruscus TaxID=42192 RepID=A0A6J8E4H1_MYTCO|nr:unnamed protein product [Mytilus coruscus]
MKPYLQDIAYDIYVTCLKHNVFFKVEWIPRAQNEIADYISRIINTDDCRNAVHILNIWIPCWGPHEIDWFASDHNHRLPVFYSRYWNVHSMGIDAFTVNWQVIHGWCSEIYDIAELSNDLDSQLGFIPDLLAYSKSDNIVKKYYFGFLQWKKWAK